MPIEKHGSVTVRREGDNEGDLRADRRLWLAADGQMVEDGDERAASLLAGIGGLILARDAKRWHLSLDGRKVVQKRPGDEPVMPTPPEPTVPKGVLASKQAKK